MEKTGQKLTEAREALKKAVSAVEVDNEELDGLVIILGRGKNIEVFNCFDTGKELYVALATLAAEVTNPDGAVYAAQPTLQ